MPPGWRISPVGEVVGVHKEQVTPEFHPTRQFHHFSIPAYDENNGPVMESGRDIGSNKTTVPPNSVLVSKLNPRIPRVWMPEIEERHHAIASTEFLVLRPTHIDRGFLKHLFLSPLMSSELVARATGTTRSHQRVRAPDVLAIPVGLPPLPEQRKIAAILSSVDDAIEKTQAVIDQVQVAKRGLMQELLTRGLPGGHTRFKQTEIGAIPVCWQLALLAEVLDGIDAGWSPKCEGRPAALSEWGVLKVSSISSGHFKPHENKVLAEGLETRVQLEVMEGDVLVARASGVLGLVGRSAFVHGTRPRLMLSDKTLRLKAKESVLRPMFLSLLLEDPRVRRQILMRTTGSHMRNISQQALRRVLVPVPSLDEQERIEVLEVYAGTRLEEERKSQDQLEAVKRTLMSVLLTGELRLTPDTEVA